LKRGLTVVLAVIVLLTCSFLIYRNVEIQKANKKIGQIRNEVVNYLNTKNGCSENNYDLKVEYYFQSRFWGYNPYVIKVTYKDEPNVIYYYDYRNGAISQKGASPMNGKDDDKNFKHDENKF
jgi:uncharacterized protein YxeA